MTISKAVKIFCEFCSSSKNVPFESADKFSDDFENFLTTKKFCRRKRLEINYKLHIAIVKEFIELNGESKTYEDIFSLSSKLSDYELDREHKRLNFIYGLIGTAIGCGATLLGIILKTFI